MKLTFFKGCKGLGHDVYIDLDSWGGPSLYLRQETRDSATVKWVKTSPSAYQIQKNTQVLPWTEIEVVDLVPAPDGSHQTTFTEMVQGHGYADKAYPFSWEEEKRYDSNTEDNDLQPDTREGSQEKA